MAGYIVLWKLTEKGRDNLKQLPETVKGWPQQLEASGSRHIGTWLTMGEYDGVTILDIPDDLTASGLLLQNALQGLSVTNTMRAFSEEEYTQVIARLE